MFGLGGRNVGQMWLRSRSFFTSSLKRGGHDEGHHDIGGIPGNVRLAFYIIRSIFLDF